MRDFDTRIASLTRWYEGLKLCDTAVEDLKTDGAISDDVYAYAHDKLQKLRKIYDSYRLGWS